MGFNGIPIVGCEVTLKVGGLVGKPDQGAPGVQDLLHPHAAGPKAVHTLPDHGENALGGGPLRVRSLHLVIQRQASLWLSTENTYFKVLLLRATMCVMEDFKCISSCSILIPTNPAHRHFLCKSFNGYSFKHNKRLST